LQAFQESPDARSKDVARRLSDRPELREAYGKNLARMCGTAQTSDFTRVLHINREERQPLRTDDSWLEEQRADSPRSE
jgi:hypothetical protein